MFGNDIFTRVKRSENKKMAEIAQFLHENDLSVDTTVEVFITVTRDEKLIACGGIAGNIIKCVAISESVRGEGLALTLATELINLAYERHSTHLFIYTKTEYEALFRQCGFSTLTSVPGVMVLMENSATRLKRYAESLKKFRHPGNKIGCIVMNANPFTNGHRYLIQQAAAQCDWLHLFLVKEDSSYMAPCEQCVYIRYAMFVMVIGGLVAAINPKNIILKLIGCVMAFYGSILGLKFSLKLNDIHHAVHNPDPDSLFGVQGCSTDPTFPFNLPLAQWAPNWFKPTGDCGYDAPIVPDGVTLSSTQQWFVEMYQQSEGWYLLPPWHFMNMAQACMLAFGMCLVLLVIMSGAWALKIIRG